MASTGSRISRRSRGTGENLSDQAAWLYTDLLLGLAVVFMGGGALLGQLKTDGGDSPTVMVDPTPQLSCNEIQLRVPESISIAELDLRVAKLVNDRGIFMGWTDTKPALVRLLGSGVDVSDGDRRAGEFERGRLKNSQTLGRVEYIAGGTTKGSAGTMFLDIYVVYKGQAADNGCK